MDLSVVERNGQMARRVEIGPPEISQTEEFLMSKISYVDRYLTGTYPFCAGDSSAAETRQKFPKNFSEYNTLNRCFCEPSLKDFVQDHQ